MAKQLPFTNDQGIKFDQSYWRITNININILDKTATFTVNGYKDKAARDAGYTPVSTRNYSITGAQFMKRFAYMSANPVNIFEYFYNAVVDIKDVDTEEKDGNNNPIKKSFFDGAEDV